jgi:hypothetical protein
MGKVRLSLISKLCFSVGGLPYIMFMNSLAFYITPFFLEIAQVNKKMI